MGQVKRLPDFRSPDRDKKSLAEPGEKGEQKPSNQPAGIVPIKIQVAQLFLISLSTIAISLS